MMKVAMMIRAIAKPGMIAHEFQLFRPDLLGFQAHPAPWPQSPSACQTIQPAQTTTQQARTARPTSVGHESRPGHWQQSGVDGLPCATASGPQRLQKLETALDH